MIKKILYYLGSVLIVIGLSVVANIYFFSIYSIAKDIHEIKEFLVKDKK